ncbi:MAG TPA: hypothetical protein VM282_13565 [Acidimicrobiales bacterium]|nr:hypothetical protein [Acidimicrobiales bacterium]
MTSANATDQAAADGKGVSDLDALDEFNEKLNAFRAFRSNDTYAANKLFESLGGRGRVEEDMLLQLGAWLPLYKPDRFEQSHHVVMRALEVLYRNGHRKGPVGLPTFLVGGAFASSMTGLLSNIGESGGSNKVLLLILAVVLYGLLVAFAYGVIRGAGIGCRRIKMALDRPLENLWEVVGAAGDPPKDHAKTFAVMSLVIMAVAAVAVPVIAAIVFFTS